MKKKGIFVALIGAVIAFGLYVLGAIHGREVFLKDLHGK